MIPSTRESSRSRGLSPVFTALYYLSFPRSTDKGAAHIRDPRFLPRKSKLSLQRLEYVLVTSEGTPARFLEHLIPRLDGVMLPSHPVPCLSHQSLCLEFECRVTCWIGQSVAIIPGDKKSAFIFGGNYGRAVATCRTEHGWSSPMFIALEGGSVGYESGGSSTDIVMLFMN
jgi:hypothetical protein